jgi:hypothetical protein
MAAALALCASTANAADPAMTTAIVCRIIDGRGAVSYGSSKHLGGLASTRKFEPWVLAPDGIQLHDRIGLFWMPERDRQKSLRIAIDGPVSKPARLVSVTDETVVAIADTSDQRTTRSWLITVNFRHETVAAAGIASGPVALKTQLMSLSCNFSYPAPEDATRSAADRWQRCCQPD